MFLYNFIISFFNFLFFLAASNLCHCIHKFITLNYDIVDFVYEKLQKKVYLDIFSDLIQRYFLS